LFVCLIGLWVFRHFRRRSCLGETEADIKELRDDCTRVIGRRLETIKLQTQKCLWPTDCVHFMRLQCRRLVCTQVLPAAVNSRTTVYM